MTRKRPREGIATARAKSSLTFAEQQLVLHSPASVSLNLMQTLKEEQTRYLKAWKAEMTSCSVCIASRGKPNPVAHCCINHNYLPTCVEGIVPELLAGMLKGNLYNGGLPEVAVPPKRSDLGTEKCAGPPCHRLKVEAICSEVKCRSRPRTQEPSCPTTIPLETLSALCHWCTESNTGVSKSELIIPQWALRDSAVLRVAFGSPVQNPCPRRHILESVFRAAALVDNVLFPSKSYRRERLISTTDLRSTTVEAFVNRVTNVPLIPLLKIEYSSCRMYNSKPDDRKSHVLEEYSSREKISMGLASRAFPAAEFIILRVCPYTCAVIKKELLTSSQLESLLDRRFRDQVPSLLQSTWEVVGDLQQHFADDIPSGGAQQWIHMSPSGCRVSDKAPTLQIEPQGAFVCRREYLPPSSWEHSERPPFTFRSEDEQSQYIINWKSSVRDPQQYRQHDVWSHPSEIFDYAEGDCS